MYILPLDSSSLTSSNLGFTKPDLSSTGLRVSKPFSVAPVSMKKGPLMLQTHDLLVTSVSDTSIGFELPGDMDHLMDLTASFFSEHSASMFSSRVFSKSTVMSRIVKPSGLVKVDKDVSILDQFDNPTSLVVGDKASCVLLFDKVVFTKANLAPEFKLLFARKQSNVVLPDFKSLVPSIEIINHEDVDPSEVPLPSATESEMDFFS